MHSLLLGNNPIVDLFYLKINQASITSYKHNFYTIYLSNQTNQNKREINWENETKKSTFTSALVRTVLKGKSIHSTLDKVIGLSRARQSSNCI